MSGVVEGGRRDLFRRRLLLRHLLLRPRQLLLLLQLLELRLDPLRLVKVVRRERLLLRGDQLGARLGGPGLHRWRRAHRGLCANLVGGSNRGTGDGLLRSLFRHKRFRRRAAAVALRASRGRRGRLATLPAGSTPCRRIPAGRLAAEVVRQRRRSRRHACAADDPAKGARLVAARRIVVRCCGKRVAFRRLVGVATARRGRRRIVTAASNCLGKVGRGGRRLGTVRWTRRRAVLLGDHGSKTAPGHTRRGGRTAAKAVFSFPI